MSDSFDTIEAALADVAAGKPVIVTDDENRENEGDLVMAASTATPEWVNFMIRQCGGLICLPTVEHRLKRLGIGQMVHENTESHKTAFTVSVDAAEGVTTGISAYDRCRAIRILANPESRPEELVPTRPYLPALRRNPEACSSAPDTLRPPWTSPCSPVTIRPASSAKSSTTTARWRAFRS